MFVYKHTETKEDVKNSIIFKKNANFAVKQLEISQDKEPEIFKIWFINGSEHIGRF